MIHRLKRAAVLTAILLAKIKPDSRLEMRLRGYAHQQGILWSPSRGFLGMPFGSHGVRYLPVDKRHAAMVIESTARAHAAMAMFGGLFGDDDEEDDEP